MNRTCPECNGNGMYQGTIEALICTRCKGMGKLEERKGCYGCEGRGEIYASGMTYMCDWCNGTGTFTLAYQYAEEIRDG